jgi:serpin B
LKHINGWVADQTNDMIPNLVKGLPDQVDLVLVNALYFRASWGTAFADSFTAPAQFTTRGGENVEVDTMRAPLLYASHAAGEGWEAVAIPYSDSRLEMVVVMPDLGTDAAFEASLDGAVLDGIFQALAPTIVDLSLPKFDIKSTWALREALESLGMQSAFSNGSDFAGIAKGMLPIYEVFHDVAIAIDEKGTEAAAATAVVFGDEGGGEESPEFTVRVDRTFYVAIRDRDARSLMFFARIGNPKASA